MKTKFILLAATILLTTTFNSCSNQKVVTGVTNACTVAQDVCTVIGAMKIGESLILTPVKGSAGSVLITGTNIASTICNFTTGQLCQFILNILNNGQTVSITSVANGTTSSNKKSIEIGKIYVTYKVLN